MNSLKKQITIKNNIVAVALKAEYNLIYRIQPKRAYKKKVDCSGYKGVGELPMGHLRVDAECLTVDN